MFRVSRMCRIASSAARIGDDEEEEEEELSEAGVENG